jgi:stage V sporulation protein SpoVS
MRNPSHRVVFSSGFSTGTRRMSAEKERKRGKALKDSGAIETLKVSNESQAKRVGAAMAHLAREGRGVDVAAGSAKALSTALKAVAIARKYLRANEGDLGVSARVDRRGEEKSVTVLTLVPVSAKVENSVDNPYTVSKPQPVHSSAAQDV